MKKFKVIIFLGPPGSGKGTQSALLQKKIGYEYIGSGDLLRARAKKRDYTGKKIKEVIDGGKRVPTPVIFKIWMDKLEALRGKKNLKGFIVDGSPRTALEAEMLEQALEWYGWNKNKKVIFIHISPKETIERLTKRKMCKKCGRIIPYFGEFKKLKKCDRCGGDLIKRADDNIRAIKIKFKWFKTDVLPAIHFYKKRGELIEMHGERQIEKVFNDILKVL